MNPMSLRLFAAALLIVVLALQYRLWLSDGGIREVHRLQNAVTAQTQQNVELKERNEQLAAEVKDLKEGLDAVEERARSDLGMVGANETFYQVVSPPPADHAAPTGGCSDGFIGGSDGQGAPDSASRSAMTASAATPRNWAIVAAAGQGRRMDAERPKQYLQLAGATVLEHALRPLLSHPRISGIVVVLAPGDEFWPQLPLATAPRCADDGGR